MSLQVSLQFSLETTRHVQGYSPVEASLHVKRGLGVPLEFSIYSTKVCHCNQSQPIILGGKMWIVEVKSYQINLD